ncbi:biliverdin-producing heme oxygenase [Legionella shakespearei]|uniref:Heme oxygenase n=1 Tax=Legionella shakespearei DSM 23087 TaxID=1122169 RepID=A0A0W0YZN9_9GAMM|nr:biliverdin-producing heme oxygenase [Legionella shakespearei]KTD62356.1 heme oxygenase [Legionella shakespearei DSM 23087]
MFSKALMNATYKNGRPGQLTAEHEKAEHHRFKSEFLFKNPAIPKNVYVSRLIQHFLIIKALETRLQQLPETAQADEISAFFALSYLEQLWRTPGIAEDLRQLGVSPDEIKEGEIAKTTNAYLQTIQTLSSKALLAHFLLHVAGFMHGGNIIQKKYIDPSNELTAYKIPANQYDFSGIYPFLPEGRLSALNVYQDMMKQIDNIELNEDEFAELLEQCKSVYDIMSGIYDDLCDLHTQQLKSAVYSPAGVAAGIVVIALILKILVDFLPVTPGFSPSR